MSELMKFFRPKGNDPAPGFGGIPTVTPEMVAGACHGMTRQVYLYGLAKWAGDENVIDELVQINRQAVEYRALVNRWRIQRPDDPPGVLRQLADMALDAALVTQLCRRCKGRGYMTLQRACRNCRGSGRRRPPGERKNAETLGVTRERWRYYWKPRFISIVHDYEVWDGYIDAHLRKNIFGNG